MSNFIQPTRTTKKPNREGIICPDCGGKTTVNTTRNGPGEKVRRVRICKDCGNRLNTFELVIGSQSAK
jgi:transcriptional regulator NrdR family protein